MFKGNLSWQPSASKQQLCSMFSITVVARSETVLNIFVLHKRQVVELLIL